MSDSETVARIKERLEQARRLLILTHHNPDGDALGSAVGLARLAARPGLRIDLHISGTYTDNLQFLLDGPEPGRADLEHLDQYDLIAFMDCHSFDRLGAPLEAGLPKLFERRPDLPVLVFDHHLLNRQTVPSGLWCHRPGASSTGELVWEIFSGWPVSASAAEALLTAVATDTGFFTQVNATPSALRAAADLIEAGASLEVVDQHINANRPLRRLRLLELCLGTLELHLEGRLAAMFLTQDMLARSGAVIADSDLFVEELRDISGVFLAALLRETAPGGPVKVSLRSRPEMDAAVLARRFGGGGHYQAAAYTDEAGLDIGTALRRLLAAAPEFLPAREAWGAAGGPGN